MGKLRLHHPIYLAREGKLDVLKDLFSQLKNTPYFYQALKAKDRFGQTPMLSAINAPENRSEILKFLFEVILENKSDEALFEVAVFNSNKHNDTTLTLLMKNHDVFRDTIGLFFTIFCEYFNKRVANALSIISFHSGLHMLDRFRVVTSRKGYFLLIHKLVQ